MSFSLSNHNNSKRVRVINLNESDLDRLIFPFKKHSILSLEYKPFSRFSLAKSLDEVFQNKLSKTLNDILNDRDTGTAIVEPDIKNKIKSILASFLIIFFYTKNLEKWKVKFVLKNLTLSLTRLLE